jgi:hypothetical protein
MVSMNKDLSLKYYEFNYNMIKMTNYINKEFEFTVSEKEQKK